ncbi:MAG: hypothetical protein HYT89_07580, partial [Candidatus Omnitrophica bacterium]|nr:hypothetical protein [Candidatus Omnitrophota bacterium]
MLGDLALDEAGLIQSAHFEVQVFQNGEVLSQEVPDGTKVFYTQGRVDYTLSKTGIRSTYHYDSSTQILLFVDSDDFRADYYPDGSLKEFWSKPDQKRSFYEGGLLTRILTSEGAE